jgi:hypothetical protein
MMNRLSLAMLLIGVGIANADEPTTPVVREPIVFKDLTPPELEKHIEATSHATEVAHHAPEGGFSGFAEYLLMRPRRGAFDFAIRDPNRDLIPSGALESLNYELRSGLRAGFQYQADSGWDSRLAYTYFRSSADRSITASPAGTLYATLTRPGLNDEARTANASAGLEFNTFDLQFGTKIHHDERSTIRAFAGLSWASIRQEFSVRYDGADANQGLVTTRNDFTGFGPIAGLEGSVNVTKHWSLFGRAAGGLYTGTLKTPIRETNNAGLTTYADLDAKTRRVVPMTSLTIGGGWQSGRVTIRAGYEISNWFGLIEQPRFSGELSEGRLQSRSGDFSMEGLFVQFGLGF